ncbi:hypothetical protein [Reyranella sp.]|uniref:hypothetical protein n=1 Tax=Reyranella sp. TaxID=1929291 RepID=UPI003D1142F2
MLLIDDPRVEKEVEWVAKHLGVPVPEAIVIACKRLRWAELDRVLAEIRERHPLPVDPEERARLTDHSYLYGPDGLPK